MNKLVLSLTAIAITSAFSLASAIAAEPGSKAKELKEATRQNDLPQASTTPKRSPIGDKVSDYKPAVKSAPMKEPPSPPTDKPK